jgi:ABC-2 type transport system ATP-binding protein
MDVAISTRGLTKQYRGVTALADLTLEVPAGAVFGFLGPNGAGKTTVLKILAGLTRASSGNAEIDGISVGRQGAHRAKVGYLAQDPRFYGWMTGRETLEYVGGFAPPGVRTRRPADLLDLVGLADAADRPTRTYSGGMRQRLGIAQALAGDAKILLLDEPAAALDPIGRHDVLQLLERLRGEVTVFYSTHILDDVQRVSDHVAILDRGRLITSAPTTELVDRSAAGPLEVGLIGATPETATALAEIPGVATVRSTLRSGDEWRFDVTVHDDQIAMVQREVMRIAVEQGLVVATNRQETLDLEDVFLRIVDQERAA